MSDPAPQPDTRPTPRWPLILGALFAAITGLFPVRIPGTKTSVSVAEIFVLLLLLDYNFLCRERRDGGGDGDHGSSRGF